MENGAGVNEIGGSSQPPDASDALTTWGRFEEAMHALLTDRSADQFCLAGMLFLCLTILAAKVRNKVTEMQY